jgi:hypothetical protein
MSAPADVKLGWMNDFLGEYARQFTVLPMGLHVDAIEQSRKLPLVEPRFPAHDVSAARPSL